MGITELLPITKELYQQMMGVAWIMIGPMFLLACVFEYFKKPHDFPALDMLRRLVLTVILLEIFPYITTIISDISNALADRIGEKQALEVLFKQLRSQTDPVFQFSKIPFLLSSDGYIAFLNYLSFSFVYLVKFIMVAVYHFYWSLIMALAPLAILCFMFPDLSQVTTRLLSSLVEISSWNVVWQIMGVMLLGLSYVHPTPGNYFDAICFNFLLALGMIAAPFVVHSFFRQGISSPSLVSGSSVLSIVSGPVGQIKQFGQLASKAAGSAKQSMRRTFPKGGK